MGIFASFERVRFSCTETENGGKSSLALSRGNKTCTVNMGSCDRGGG